MHKMHGGKSMTHGRKLYYRFINKGKLFQVKDSYFHVTDEIKKILTGDSYLI